MEDKKLRIFISQPMANKTDEEIFDASERVAKKIKNYFNDDVQIVQSYIDDDNVFTVKPIIKNMPLYYLSKSLELLSRSDVIVMATGWENNRGCITEYECARRYGILVIFEDSKYITGEKLFEVDNDSTSGYKLLT